MPDINKFRLPIKLEQILEIFSQEKKMYMIKAQ